MSLKKSLNLSIILLIILFPITVTAQEGGKLSFLLTPGVNIPMAASSDIYTTGGGGEFAAAYSLPFAPLFFAKGAIDYSMVPTLAENNLTLTSFGAGAGVSYDVLPWLNLLASVSAGYGLGFYSGETGGSAYLEASAQASFMISPSFGLGLGAGYRHYVGDPDPFYQTMRINLGTVIRLGAGGGKANIKIQEIRFDPVFPVFYKHYDDHELGSMSILNNENGSIKNVKVSLFINQYMDGPKECMTIPEIKKGETVEVPLYALFTDNVLSITEGTKVNAKLLVSYKYAKRDLSHEVTETVRMYDRNAMTWDDDKKAATFVTAKDPEILKFSKNIAGLVRKQPNRAVNLNFRIGIGLFEAFGEQGVNYVKDPQTPYDEFSKDSMAVDYLQFPVQTLDYKAGDCDDLSICYAAMLESCGIKTAFITIPGHIFMAFSLGFPKNQADKFFLNPGDLIYHDNNTWLPVEITMVQYGFLKAWEKGAKEWRDNKIDGKAKIFSVHEAWKSYEPVGLSNSGISLVAAPTGKVLERYTKAVNRVVEMEIAEKVERYEGQIRQSGSSRKINRLGVLYARYGLTDKAMEQFKKAAAKQYLPSYVNLGNILFLEKKYDEALGYYKKAEDEQPNNVKVLLGIAKVNYELENQGTVKRVYAKLMQKDPGLAERFSYLVSATGETGRASSAMISETVVWDEE